ncbi:MAG: hypothetical protein EZS28_015993 [Streblomastix strix]|uniref:Uncharacterized protein n=1 Tax=Streblomastix strix TaxID=222440 RepID=A0A5J4W0X0_9EUKA|nr:MAG: hypothetical protein EZS28_015993 [Streblomastix strix]
MSSEQIEETFDKSLFKDIAKQFDKCKTQAELNLLDVIEVIAKCAAEHESQKYRQNFANIFVKSGLLDCILNGINECVPDDQSSKDNSDSQDDFIDNIDLGIYQLKILNVALKTLKDCVKR